MKDKQQSGVIVLILGALISGGIGAVSNIFGNRAKRKEADKSHERQKELMDKSQGQNKEMYDYQQAGGKEMFNYTQARTNASAQVAQMKEAGINPALMYGGSGAGGQSVGAGQTGGGASSGGAPQAQKADVQSIISPMDMAQISLLKAQKENIEADTKKKTVDATKTAGVDTESAEETVKNQKFINDVNQAIGVGTKANRESAEAEIQQLLAERMNADWETYKTVGYGNEPFDSKESLAGKIIEAGYTETIARIKAINAGIGKTNAEKAKVMQQKIIDGYKERLVEEGINPDAVPIQKLIIDSFRKIGTPEEFKDKVNKVFKK